MRRWNGEVSCLASSSGVCCKECIVVSTLKAMLYYKQLLTYDLCRKAMSNQGTLWFAGTRWRVAVAHCTCATDER